MCIVHMCNIKKGFDKLMGRLLSIKKKQKDKYCIKQEMYNLKLLVWMQIS